MTARSVLAVVTSFASAAISFADPPFDDGSGYLVGHRHPIESDPCVETSDVLGYRRCPGFAEWADARASPQVTLEAGAIFRHFARPDVMRTHAGIAALAIAPPRASEDLVGWDLRIAFGVQRYLYVGLETARGEIATGNVTDYDAVIGVNGTVGSLMLGVEFAGGVRRLTTAADVANTLVLEPRVRAGFWLSPWLTLCGAAGTSLVDQDAWMVGLYLGLHTYAYGGLR